MKKNIHEKHVLGGVSGGRGRNDNRSMSWGVFNCGRGRE